MSSRLSQKGITQHCLLSSPRAHGFVLPAVASILGGKDFMLRPRAPAWLKNSLSSFRVSGPKNSLRENQRRKRRDTPPSALFTFMVLCWHCALPPASF